MPVDATIKIFIKAIYVFPIFFRHIINSLIILSLRLQKNTS